MGAVELGDWPDQRPNSAKRNSEVKGHGPLQGIRVVEFAGLGPTPFSCMMLADMGADVIRIERLGQTSMPGADDVYNYLNRSRHSIGVDLKAPDGIAFAKELIRSADVLVEGFRPGKMEKLGLGPDEMIAANQRLIYARMTGWGQSGDLARTAGHDINYLSMTGGLYLMGPADRPPLPPLNFAANFGGGGMVLVSGVLAALVERASSGMGQVIDAAMVDGASLLLTQIFAWSRMGVWREGRGGNLLDGSAYFYRCYETSDGQFMAVGALEPQFHALFIEALGLDPSEYSNHLEPDSWPYRAEKIAAIFLNRSRAEWVEHFAGIDACVTPVLTPQEAVYHPSNVSRDLYDSQDGDPQPRPAPRFARTPTGIRNKPTHQGSGVLAQLERWGIAASRMEALREKDWIVAN